MIPLCRPSITEKEKQLVCETLDSGWLAHGPNNKEFEKLFTEYLGVKHAISLNSCTSALFLAIVGGGLEGEVIVPSFTFIASANAVETARCKTIFADIKKDTCNIDPESVRKCISDKTSAIMPVHYGGQACEMDEIMEIAEENNLIVIEDSAETLGGTYKGKKAGSFGIGCFSFFPTKNITTGEGGMLTTNDDALAQKASTLMGHGIPSSTFAREKKKNPWIRNAALPGYNFRMSNVLAALGVVQMSKLDKLNEMRRSHAAYLNKNIAFDGLELPTEHKDCKHVYQMYTLKTNGFSRDGFVNKLREKGVGASVHFDPPAHLNTFYNDPKYLKTPLPVTEEVAKNILTLPMYPDMTQEDLEDVVRAIEETVKELK